MYKILTSFSLIILLSGCVSKTKYRALVNQLHIVESQHYQNTSELAEAKRKLRRIEENSGLEQQQKIAAQDSTAAALSEKIAYINELKKQLQAQESSCQNRIAATNANKEAEQKAKNLAQQKNIVSQLQNNVFATTDSSLWSITTDGQFVRISLIEASLFKPNSRILEITGKPLLVQLATFLLQNPDIYITLLSYAPESVPFLAQVRSHNIYSFLLSLQIPSKRIQELWREKPTNSPLNNTEIILSLSPLL